MRHWLGCDADRADQPQQHKRGEQAETDGAREWCAQSLALPAGIRRRTVHGATSDERPSDLSHCTVRDTTHS
jgi:hypothetical protein